MGADDEQPTAPAGADAGPLAGIAHPNPLAGNPGAPRFPARVATREGIDLAVADPVVTRVALALMNMNAAQGGAASHWGGPAAMAEIMSSIHGLMFRAEDWREAYNFANDAGHTENGLYALKANYGYAGLDYSDLKGFRSLASKLTGHGEGHCFPEGVMISNGPLGSSLPVCQGMAMADRLAGRDRLTVCVLSDGAAMEGEAKEALAAIPGLAARGRLAPMVMVVSDNDTKLSGRISEQSFRMEPSFATLETLGWRVARVASGNDLQAVFTAVEQAFADARADATRPVAVWCKTVKGFGVKDTEESPSGGHGYPLKTGDQVRPFIEEIWTGAGRDPADLPTTFTAWLDEIEAEHARRQATAGGGDKPPAGKVQSGFPKAMIRAAREGLPVVSLSADLPGSTGVKPFQAEYPERSVDLGVAEANMASAGAGYAKLGYVPVIDTFAQFGTTKGLLPLFMGILSNAPVIACYTHVGLQDAADGASHQALFYLAATAAVPHLLQYVPCSAEEAEWALHTAITRYAEERRAGGRPEGVILFCGRENFPLSLKPAGADYDWGKAMVMAETGADHDPAVVLSATGSMVYHAMAAAEDLAAQGIGAVVLNNATPNHPDVDGHREALARCDGRLVTIEEHELLGGAGSMLKAGLLDAGVSCRVRSLGLDDTAGRSAYSAPELYDHFGIGRAAIAVAAGELVG